MPLWRNENESNYVGGKKHFTDVIKNSGSEEMLIYRCPEEDFNTNSTLIVNPGEEAIFIKGGEIQQVFEKGTYKLSTQNYPFISRLRNAFSGGISAFNCLVYYVKTAHTAEILWGTDNPIKLRDPVHKIRTDARANGSYKIQISNPTLFLEKLVGSNVTFRRKEDLQFYFMSEFLTEIKSTVAEFLSSGERELIGIEMYLSQISKQIHPEIAKLLEPYGIKCISFNISTLDIDETKYDELDRNIIEANRLEMQAEMEKLSRVKISEGERIAAQNAADAESYRTQRVAEGQKAAMDILGDDWRKQKSADILTAVAENPGSGGTANLGAGLGMGIGTASVFSDMAREMMSPMGGSNGQPSPMQRPSSSGRFTQQGAAHAETQEPAQPRSGANDRMERLKEAKSYFDMGLITQEEFEQKKKAILDKI